MLVMEKIRRLPRICQQHQYPRAGILNDLTHLRRLPFRESPLLSLPGKGITVPSRYNNAHTYADNLDQLHRAAGLARTFR